jgi:hypothetical protein
MKIHLYLIAAPPTAMSNGPERRLEVSAGDPLAHAHRLGGMALGTTDKEDWR